MFSKNETSPRTNKSIETIIGPSVKVEGNFKGEGDLIIEGVLVGSLQTKNNLKVGQNAVIQANINANNAFVSGKVKGNIRVKGKLEVTGTAMILGDVTAQILSIASGALIKGNINMPLGNITVDEAPHKPDLKKEVPAKEAEAEKK